MIEEHANILLNEDLPQDGLHKGDIGVVLHIHQDGEAYEVEFLTMGGSTVAVRTLQSSLVQAVDSRMIPHVREIVI